jgi:hypothetical protein
MASAVYFLFYLLSCRVGAIGICRWLVGPVMTAACTKPAGLSSGACRCLFLCIVYDND